MRAFIGIPIDKMVTKKIFHQAKKYESLCKNHNLKITDPSNYHITLSFLGEINTLQLMHLEDQLSNLETVDPFKLQLTVMAPFPLGAPKVIAIMVQNNDTLFQLREKIIKCVNFSKIFQKKSNYIPHLTIFRVKINKNLNDFYYPLMEINLTLDINQIVLYESKLVKSGAQYIPKLKYQF